MQTPSRRGFDSAGLNRELNARHLDRIVEAVLNTAGDTQPSVRRTVEARAAELGGRPTSEPGQGVPSALADYVDKVALHAYKITDADIEGLRKAGYSEDDIFEVTLSAAVGAGMARFERGMAAMRGVGL